MTSFESDSSEDEGSLFKTSSMILGFASKIPTDDVISRLGGRPTWIDNLTFPPGDLGKCKVCGKFMSLLLQLDANLPEIFAGHERRLYVFICRREACRRKQGCVRGFRALRKSIVSPTTCTKPQPPVEVAVPAAAFALGETLFGATKSFGKDMPGPKPVFAPTTSTAGNTVAWSQESLSTSFAEKVKIGVELKASGAEPPLPSPWPRGSEMLAKPFPMYYLDADYEILSDQVIPQCGDVTPDDDGDDMMETDKDIVSTSIEHQLSIDSTFQKFADKIAQNPEQVLRYEFRGQPLLYSKTDAIGKLLGKKASRSLSYPKCENCGSLRTFELQITPHSIAILEEDEIGFEGMDWGTIFLASCSADCGQTGKTTGDLSYVEEWIGVQWEEVGAGPF